ncbi:helix-turn-helix transcriptional regulator [Actinomycetospora termitidis]|uniref:Helix-turn-helix domain-containing protein n=1 Tax=Actinomycetospora termitidis TaxID=3053470 RepID=A0ABT7MFJ1_9PSEU|nr:helix-turn-helix domain-containing protein [Actinomycetospora sp. Odt1-22]MDL5159441.1 helix-turn-helix domain-containing protein [Actinomycetospora sp. Odt1-22]
MSRQPARLLSAAEVAAWLDVDVSTLRRWRAAARGPKWSRVGRDVRYAREDVKKWLETSR